MKKILMASLAGLTGAVLVGCDWTGVGEDETYSDRFNWVSFSGVYRAATGGILITDYTVTASTESGLTNRVLSEVVFTVSDPAQTVFSGSFDYGKVIPSTVQITAGGFVYTDNGSGALAGTGGRTGAVGYDGGTWSIDTFGGLAAGTKITAEYSYSRAPSPGTGGPNPGTTGKPIFSLNVVQSGNKVTITDNNGATYSGKVSSIRSTGGQSQDLPGGTALPADGETITASFEASGRSAAGVQTRIVGAFSGVAGVTAATETTAAQVQIGSRKVNGTWIEPGKTGDMNGVASNGTVVTVP